LFYFASDVSNTLGKRSFLVFGSAVFCFYLYQPQGLWELWETRRFWPSFPSAVGTVEKRSFVFPPFPGRASFHSPVLVWLDRFRHEPVEIAGQTDFAEKSWPTFAL
jgi:hypothetical protein